MIQPLNPKHHELVPLQPFGGLVTGSNFTQDTCNGSLGGSQVRFPPNSLPPPGDRLGKIPRVGAKQNQTRWMIQICEIVGVFVSF